MLSRDALDRLYAFAQSLTKMSDDQHLVVSELLVNRPNHDGLYIELVESVAMLELVHRAPYVLEDGLGKAVDRAAEKFLKLYDEIEADYLNAILDQSDSFVTVLGARLEWVLHELKERMEG